MTDGGKKVQPARQIPARKPRYPTGKAGTAGHPRIGRLSDLGFLLDVKKLPAITRRNGAFVVGYLDFCAGIFPNRCTNCTQDRLGTTLLKQAVDSLRYCGIATRPDARGTSNNARLSRRTAKQFFFRECSTSLSPSRPSAFARNSPRRRAHLRDWRYTGTLRNH